MLTWVWLAHAKHELTKPKSTFRPQNFLSGLRAPHEQSFPFPTVGGPDDGRSRRWAVGPQWAVVTRGQLSPGGSHRRGQLSGGELSGGQLSGGELSAHPHMGSFHVKIHYINILSIQ